MEVASVSNKKHIVFLYEALGTAMLIYAINMQFGQNFGQYGIGFMLFAWLLICGPITGAHFNPAVTIGVYVSNKSWKKDTVMFFVMIAAQVFGALFGICLVWASLYNGTGKVETTSGGVPKSEMFVLLPALPNVRASNAFQIELMCTWFFVLINLLVKTQKTSPSSDGFLACLTVALTLLAMACLAGPRSGGCLNPAIAIG